MGTADTSNSRKKITSREALAEICAQLRAQGAKIGFTSGAFDLLHAGHVDYLEKAKGVCDVLIVGINSDSAVRAYKGDERPIVPQEQRAYIVAALSAVDWVFLFDERRNKVNIETLKPHLYIKAGDYGEDQLTSKEIVERYGGKVYLIPVAVAESTSQLIHRIAHTGSGEERTVEQEGTVHIQRPRLKTAPALFLDRDGTINEDIGYVHDPEKLLMLPNAVRGIKKFQDMGYRIVIITNQGGIGLGYYTVEDFYRVSSKMLSIFNSAGIVVDKIYFCPHSKAENCHCRKPATGLIELACQQLNIDIKRSILIGDRTVDLETARRAGCKSILVTTGSAGQDGEYKVVPDYTAVDIADAARLILTREREKREVPEKSE